MTQVRRIRADEWTRWRELRLAALMAAPYAFLTTYEQAAARPDEVWQQQTAGNAAGDESWLGIAEDGAEWLGSAGVTRGEGRAAPELFAMWVVPGVRGRGVGEALVTAAADWARETGGAHLDIWVTDINTHARALYERLGAVDTGVTQPLPANPSLQEILLRLDL